MDHLPLPHNPASIEIAPTPYLATVEYDERSFDDYPSRHGWTLRGFHGSMRIEHDGSEVSVSQVGGMLQTWLFFGLLFAITGETIVVHDFVRFDAIGSKILNTEPLGALVCRWSEKLIMEGWSLNQIELETWKDNIYKKILQAREVILRVKGTPKYAELDLVCMSNASLGEYLIQALKDIFIKRGLISSINQSWRILGFSDCGEPLRTAMLNSGWCPYKISCLDGGKAISIGKLWYFAHMAPPNAGEDHKRKCSFASCQSMNIDKKEYQIAHETPHCLCTSSGPDPEDLASALQNGVIPIIRAQPAPNPNSDTISLHAEPYSSGMEYVAISHVWADGHGNPDGNTLPSCFLSSLIRRLQSLPLSDPPRFWLDTLCVPRQGDLKKLALSRLKEPYELASYVLVVDSYLSSLDSAPMSTIEIVARIEASTWSQRLWTFEEGRLPGERILFHFRDRAVNLFDLVQNEWRENFFSHTFNTLTLGRSGYSCRVQLLNTLGVKRFIVPFQTALIRTAFSEHKIN